MQNLSKKPNKFLTKKLETKQRYNSPMRKRRGTFNFRGRKMISKTKPFESFSQVLSDNIRIILLGGVEEVGKNMIAIEAGSDIIIIDIGFQFRNYETPGIDFIIPDIKYLEQRKNKIRGIIITHGHYDHIGAIPYLIEKLDYPPIYACEISSLMILKRQDDFPYLKKLNLKIIEKNNEKIKLGNLTIGFFGVSHSIPDSMGLIIETPYGNIIHTGDLRIDNTRGVPTPEEEEFYTNLGNKKNLLLMSDSTNAENPGFSLSEKIVLDNIEQIIKESPGRLIIGTFASQLKRSMEMIKVAEKYNKKVIIDGRSMKNNIEIVKKMGLLKTKPGTIIPVEEIDKYPNDKIVVIATGSQGEEYSSFDRMANKTHKFIRLKKNDTVLLSSSIIPGNEISIQRIKDNISRQGSKIVSYRISEVHASGHANGDELMWLIKKIKPKFFIPIEGYRYMLSVHAELAILAGVKENNIIIPDNGSIIEIQDKGEKIVQLKEKAPSSMVMVDGFSIGEEQEIVIRDRVALAQDGIFVIIAIIDNKTGKLRKSPDLISRGFVYLKENQELLNQSRLITKKTVEELTKNMHPFDFEYIKSALVDNISKFLFQKTAKRPLVIPVLLNV